MTLLDAFYWLQYSSLLVAMRDSPWVFPVIAVAHLLGLAVVGGTVLVVDLRLMGLGLTRQPIAQVARGVEPWLIASLAVMLITGAFLFMCFATKYYYLTAFWVKVTALPLVVAFTFSVRRRAVMDAGTSAGPHGKLIALVSLALWASVALSGRLIGFP